MNATKTTKIARLVCAGLLLLATGAVAEEGDKAISKINISLGTATPGGGFPLYGDAVTAVINETDPSLAVEPRKERVEFRAEFEHDGDREELEARIDRLERLLESGSRDSGSGDSGTRATTKRETQSRATRPASARRATGSRGGNAKKR